jgi:hypothetical protein
VPAFACWADAVETDQKDPAKHKVKIVFNWNEHILDKACENPFQNNCKKEMMQALVRACIIIRLATSVVELQRQLDVSWRLSAGDLSHRRA